MDDAQLYVNNHQQRSRMLLKDKIAAVYGAGGGVGSAIARKFAPEGGQVYLTGRRLDPIKKIAAEISYSGGKAKAAEQEQHQEDSCSAVSLP
jgi:NADP-dependent 3-hydroxy acid dehydrogenase YdfG